MRLAVVIVNYNVKYYLAQTLHSLYKSLNGESAEVFVVDNNSTDGSKELIGQLFPKVNYIYNDSNVGFSRGCNQAIRLSTAEYVLILNPDTIVPEHNIEAVLSFMESHREAGACGVRMINGYGNFLPESKRGFPSSSASLKRFTGLGGKSNGYYLSELDEMETHEVEVLAGAYIMARRKALDAVGLLDEDYFMFGEDIELSVRMRECGYKNYYLPETILHYKGESTDRNEAPFIRNFYGAMTIFIGKHSSSYNVALFPLMRVVVGLMAYTKIASIKISHLMHRGRRRRERRHPRFIVFTDERGAASIRNILKRNGVEEGCHYMIGNERTASDGHAMVSAESRFTHVIYDSKLFSYETMVRLIDKNHHRAMQLGVYHRDIHCIITPDGVYR